MKEVLVLGASLGRGKWKAMSLTSLKPCLTGEALQKAVHVICALSMKRGSIHSLSSLVLSTALVIDFVQDLGAGLW